MKNLDNKTPYVNPILKSLSFTVAIMAIVMGAFMVIIYMSTESGEYLLYAVLTGFIGMIAYGYNRKITKEYDQWSYRNTKANAEEKEIIIDDYFKLSTNGIGDDYWTCTANHIISSGLIYLIHPYEAAKFELENPGVGTKLLAKVILENKQLKIIDFTIVDKQLNQGTNNKHITSRITEKHLNDYPRYTRRYEPRDTTEELRTWRLILDNNVIKNTWDNRKLICYVKIDKQQEKVSMEDFLKYKIGDAATFTRNKRLEFI